MKFHPVFVSQKAFVINGEGKFLILFRTETAPTRPNTWDLPGGIFETGEDPEAAVRREIREEAGIEVTEVRPLRLVGEHSKRGDFVVTVAYIAKAAETDVVLSYEHNDFRWVSVEEFVQLESSEKWKALAEMFADELR